MRLSWTERAPPSATLVALGGLSAIVLAVARFLRPHEWGLFACPLRSATGLPCLTCGMTRAFGRLVSGDVVEALHASPLGSLLAAAAMLAATWLLLRVTFVRRGIRAECGPREERLWRYGVGAALVLNWTWVAVTG